MAFIYDLSDTWNDAGTTFIAIKMNVTDTASAAGSKLIDLQVGGTTRFDVDKNGQVKISAGTALLPSLATLGDTNTGMWFPAADTMAWSTAGSERMRIDSSGNVGIGTSSPGTNRLVLSATGNCSQLILGSDAAVFFLEGTNFGEFNTIESFRNGVSQWKFGGPGAQKAFAIWTDAQERLRVDSSGNVGIGTATFGTSAAKVFALGNATAPSTGPADTLQIYSSDLSAGNTMLSLYTEGTIVNTNTTAATTHRIAIRVNGTVYYLLANTAA